MSSPNYTNNPNFQARRSRRSWSLSESDASKTLATVDEEEMFLFDEDLKPKPKSSGNNNTNNNNGGFPKTATSPDLEASSSSENIPERVRNLQLATNVTENSPSVFRSSKNVFFLHESKEHQFQHTHSTSPYYPELGSSAESEKSVCISIESLRNHLHSCVTCGVLWCEDQVSLGCIECGGYALNRPCPECDGACPAIWTKDVAVTHQLNKAKWNGTCDFSEAN